MRECKEVIFIKEMIMKNKVLITRLAAVILYATFYLLGFFCLEQRYVRNVYIMTLPIDYKIPFLEIFIIPYLLWFAYITVAVGYFVKHQEENFGALGLFLAFGMTIFLLVSAVCPNGLDLRPVSFERDNIFVDMVKLLYKSDTPTNVVPSIHVYNSLAITIAVKRSRLAKKNKGWLWASAVLTFLIILATLFLKQHSVFDLLCALVMAVVAEKLCYGLKQPEKRRKLRKQWT